MTWLENSAAIQAGSAVVQALATIAIGILTWRLATATRMYAESTAGALRLARQQFDRQLLPKLHVGLTIEGAAARLQIFNLSLCPVVLNNLFVGTDEDDAIQRFPIEIPAPAERMAVSDDITALVLRCIQPHVRNDLWAGSLRIRLSYTLEQIDRPTEWVRYQIRVQGGRVVEATRRVSDVIIQRDRQADVEHA